MLVSSVGLDAKLNADRHHPGDDSTPVRSMGSTTMVRVGADGEVDWVTLVGANVGADMVADCDSDAGAGGDSQAV